MEWRRLEVPGIDELLGAGVYYGAGPSEALGCAGAHVVVVGGGNSAGQAVVRFSRYAVRVTLLVRGPDLAASMSKYLIDAIAGIPNVDVRTGTQVVGVKADGQLREVLVTSPEDQAPQPLRADALFICIGGEPRTVAVGGTGLLIDDAGYIQTGRELTSFADTQKLGSSLDHRSHSKRISRVFSRLATSDGDRPSAVRPRSGRVPCRLPSFTSGWRRSEVSDGATPTE